MPATLSSEGLLSEYELPDYRYYPKKLLAAGTRDWSRVRFLQACDRLKIPYDLWPRFQHLKLPAKGVRAYIRAHPFALPPFDVLRDSDAEWRARAEDLFRQYCEKFLATVSKKLDNDVSAGNLVKIEKPRDTTPLELRYEWAARRYCLREPFKEISTAGYSPDRVKQTVYSIYKVAGLPDRKGK